MATKKENLTAILNIKAVNDNDDLKAFIKHEIELVSKGGKRTEKQELNEKLKDQIINKLEPNKKYLLKDLWAAAELEAYKLQKINALVIQLKKENKIVRTEEKGKAYFSLPIEATAEIIEAV